MYKHRQYSTIVVPILSVTAIIVLVTFYATGVPMAAAVAPVLFLGVVGWLFSSLTIEVSEELLNWHFGPGLIRRSERIDGIREVAPARSTWWAGWGIRFVGYGWLYNVSGYDIVKVTMRSGKVFALGTDDPKGLCAALEGAIGKD